MGITLWLHSALTENPIITIVLLCSAAEYSPWRAADRTTTNTFLKTLFNNLNATFLWSLCGTGIVFRVMKSE
jgi:hypothetical protein